MEVKMKVSFEKVCELCPEVKDLYELARIIGRYHLDQHDIDRLWYSLLKPQMSALVGYMRGVPITVKIQDKCFMGGASISELAAKCRPGQKVEPRGFTKEEEETLSSNQAYETTYKALLNALNFGR